jgi:sugar-specific transcriptional regulator TrmB
MDREILKETGLTNNESLIYKALLELGPSLAGQISRKTGLHRRTVYDTTERLIQKGLIGYILKNNRRLFEASSPEKFLDIIKQKENSINRILPEMMSLYTQSNEKQETNFYKGRLGLKTVFEDQLKKGTKEILVIGGSLESQKVLPFYFKWYNQKRIKNKIKFKMIYNQKRKGKAKIPFSEIKYLPQKYGSPMAINIYRNKVALILWNKETPLAIMIKNKEISEGYRKQFELLWKTAKK